LPESGPRCKRPAGGQEEVEYRLFLSNFPIDMFSKQQSNYQSDYSKFLSELKQKNPNIELGQRQGRALLWDKAPLDLSEMERAKASRVKQQAYVYQNKVR
jgi:hypothetical protein